MSQDCEKRIVNQANHQEKLPAVGNQILMPIHVNCTDYLQILRGTTSNGSNRLTPYKIGISEDDKKREDTIIAKSLGLEQYLVSALRQAVTDGVGKGLSPSQQDVSLCQKFNSVRANKLSTVTSPLIERINTQLNPAYNIQQNNAAIDPNSVFNVLLNLRRDGGDYFGLLSGEKQFPVRDGTMYKTNDQTREKQIEFASILQQNEKAQKVDEAIRKHTGEIQKFQEQDRIFPVKSFVTDENGNVVRDANGNGEESIAFLILPEDLTVTDVEEQLTWNGTEFVPADLRERIFNESEPLLSPFHPDVYEKYGVTESDLLAYDKLMKTSQNYSDVFSDLLVLSTLDENDLSNYLNRSGGLTQDEIDYLKAATNLIKGRATSSDISILTSNFSYDTEGSSFRKLEKKLKEEKSKDLLYKLAGKDWGKEPLYNLTGVKIPTILGGITPRLLILEMGVMKTIEQYKIKPARKALQEVKSINDFNNSKAAKEINYKISHKEFISEQNSVAGRGSTRSQKRLALSEKEFVNNHVKKLTQEAFDSGHHTIHHKWHHRLERAAGLAGVAWYTYQGINTLIDASNYEPESLERENAEIDIASAATLGGLEVLCGLGAFAGLGAIGAFAAPLIISWGIYIFYDQLKEKNIQQRDDQEKAVRIIAASRNGLIPKAFASGIVITKNQVLEALSNVDSNTNDNVYIQRANRNNVNPSVQTVNVPKTLWQLISSTITTGSLRSEPIDENFRNIEKTVQVPNIVERGYVGSIFTDDFQNKSPEEQRSSFETYVKNNCCGSIGPDLTPPAGNERCLRLFQDIGLILKTEFALSNESDLVGIAINYICNGAEPSCFTSETKIMTENGDKRISDVIIGDKVTSFDSEGNLHTSTVINTFKYENKDVSKYEFSNGTVLESTSEHPIFTEDKIFIEIGKLEIGQSVLLYNRKTVQLINKSEIGKMIVYNIEVDTHHTYVANGICVHNKTDPKAAAAARRAQVPLPDRRWENYVASWPEASGDIFNMPTARWDFSTICRESLANPLSPGKWKCYTEASRTFLPGLNEGFRVVGGSPDDLLQDDLMGDGGIPKAPAFNFPPDTPPHVRLSEVHFPYFAMNQDSINSRLSGHPWNLSEPEISIVLSGDLDRIRQYFDTNYPNSPLMMPHMVQLSLSYQESKNKDGRNRVERETYINCITDKSLSS